MDFGNCGSSATASDWDRFGRVAPADVVADAGAGAGVRDRSGGVPVRFLET